MNFNGASLTFEAFDGGEDEPMFRIWQLCVLVFEVKYNEVNIDEGYG